MLDRSRTLSFAQGSQSLSLQVVSTTLGLLMVSYEPKDPFHQQKNLHLNAISVDSSIIFANGPSLPRVEASEAVFSGTPELEGNLNLLQKHTPISKRHNLYNIYQGMIAYNSVSLSPFSSCCTYSRDVSRRFESSRPDAMSLSRSLREDRPACRI